MGDSKKWTRRAAVGSIVSGGGLMLFGTGGSTQISTYRDVEVNAGDGDDAVLQFIDKSAEAEPVEFGGSAVVYKIKDNIGAFDSEKSEVTVVGPESSKAVFSDGDEDDSYVVEVSCSDGSSVYGSYNIELDFRAVFEGKEFTITATRTTDDPVEINCYDYGSSNNYRDAGDEGQADYPKDPVGNIDSPGNVNKKYTDYATISKSGVSRAKVGYALPPVSFDGPYQLAVDVRKVSGNWSVYLVDGDGDRLTYNQGSKGKLKNTRTVIVEFTDDESKAIENGGELYLIFGTNDTGNNRVEVGYFELQERVE